MRSLENRKVRIAAALAVAALVALPVAGEAPAEAEAAVTSTPGSITWQPRADFGKLVLTVQGEGFRATREFTGPAQFAPVDDEGNTLPDGTYAWELTMGARMSDINENHYRGDEPSADGRSMKKGTAPRAPVLSGAFTIANGAIVDPSEAEPASSGPQPIRRAAAQADVDDSDAGNQ